MAILMEESEQSESLFTREELELLHKIIQPKFWDLLLVTKPKEKDG